MKAKVTDTIDFGEREVLIRNTEDFLFTEVDGESVVMNVSTGAYFGMNEVCTRIWHAFDRELTFDQLIEVLLGQYQVDEDTCRTETQDVVGKLLKSQILNRKHEVPSPG